MVCTVCHGPDLFATARMTHTGWSELVDKMVEGGANGTDEQLAMIVDYLTANFGKAVNVNRATADLLQDALGLSEKDAEAIVTTRMEKGIFKSLDDLKSVPGVDAAKIDELKLNISF